MFAINSVAECRGPKPAKGQEGGLSARAEAVLFKAAPLGDGPFKRTASIMAATIKTVVVKEGMPSVEQARANLRAAVEDAQKSALRVLKIVHGYGSTGVGGDLRIALQSTLRQMAMRGEIRDCIFGENWRTSDERTWELLKRMPELKGDSDLGKGNKGITIVIL